LQSKGSCYSKYWHRSRQLKQSMVQCEKYTISYLIMLNHLLQTVACTKLNSGWLHSPMWDIYSIILDHDKPTTSCTLLHDKTEILAAVYHGENEKNLNHQFMKNIIGVWMVDRPGIVAMSSFTFKSNVMSHLLSDLWCDRSHVRVCLDHVFSRDNSFLAFLLVATQSDQQPELYNPPLLSSCNYYPVI